MRHSIRGGLLVLVLLCVPSVGTAQSLEERFEKANSAYFDKKYSVARDAYIALRDRYQVDDPVVHYNLGNTYHQLEQWGRAVLSYKRALAGGPDSRLEETIRNNLAMTVDALINRHRKDVSKSVTVLDETHGVVYSLFHLASADTLAWIFLPTWVLMFAALFVRRLSDGSLRKTATVTAIVMALPALTVGTLLVGNLTTEQTVVRGVIVERSVRIREGRQKDAPMTDVPEGLEVRILDDNDPQEIEVQLSNGKQGWVPASAVEAI